MDAETLSKVISIVSYMRSTVPAGQEYVAVIVKRDVIRHLTEAFGERPSK